MSSYGNEDSLESVRGDDWEQPEWRAPLRGWIGGVIPMELVLGQSESAAVLATQLAVYPNGLSFRVHAFTRPLGPATLIEKDESNEHPRGFLAEGLRYGVEFEDGRLAERHEPVGGPGDFTIVGFQRGETLSPDPERNIVLSGGSGGGGPEDLTEDRFAWPLPPSGPLLFFCEWPAAGISKNRIELASDALSTALGRARMVLA